MSGQPRRHHYLPRSYLSGFTLTMKKGDSLWVTEAATGRQFQASVANAAVELDLYRLDFSPDPGAMERAIERIDGGAAEAIRHVHDTLSLPTGTELDPLVAFVALLFLRTPALRCRLWSGPAATKLIEAVRDGLKEGAELPEDARALLQRIREAGRLDAYRQALDDIERASRIVPRSIQIGTMITELDSLMSAIGNHQWTLWVAEEGASFVCSDFPAWVLPLDVTNTVRPAKKSGFGNSIVGVPLSRRIALLGSPHGPLPAVTAGAAEVAAFNSMTCLLTDRYIYSPTRDVCWLKGNHIAGVSELSEFLAERERSIGGLPGWQRLWKRGAHDGSGLGEPSM